jgi:hypothetical protein
MDNGLDVFLLGAGASHGSADCEPEAPPLGATLFDRLLERATFRKLIPSTFVAAQGDFEATLSKLWDVHPDRMIPVLNEVAIFFSEFRPGAANLYVELGRRIRQRASQTVIATLNTEMLLEMSLFGSGVPCHYEGTLPARGATILKPHGSVNFLPTLAGTNVADAPPESKRLVLLEHCNAIQVASDPSEVHRYIQTMGLPPMVAAFVPNKPIPFCAAVIRDLWAAWQRALIGARRLTIIGVGLDSRAPHIWDPLLALRCAIEYVGSDPDAEKKLAKLAPRASSASIAATTFAEYAMRTDSQRSYHLW